MRKKIKGTVWILCAAVWISTASGCKSVENEAAEWREAAEDELTEWHEAAEDELAELYEAATDGAKKQFAANVFEETEFAAFLPTKWYAGQVGKQPAVKNQGSHATCWAVSASSALEAALLPEQEIIFSAEHMVLNNAFTTEMKDGGDYLMLMAYLSGWQGPVTEEEDPYGDGYSPQGLTAAVHVQEMQLLEQADLTEIKQVLYTYGAVQTSLYMNQMTTERSLYYNEQTAAYYMSEQAVPDHDILVLGWDDTFSRFQFAQVPPVDGAFICQNTWGDAFGKNGIFYVSYADANILQSGLVYSRVENKDNYNVIYQSDACGWQGKQGYGSETCWFANVYTADQGSGQIKEEELWQTSVQTTEGESQQTTVQTVEKESQQTNGQVTEEWLAAVGFYAPAKNTQYELYLVRDFETSSDLAKAEREFLQNGNVTRAGYYTVDLNQLVKLENGKKFALVMKITAPGEKNPVAVEYQADEYTKNVILEGKESYLSLNGERWENTQERFGTNVCLKGYSILEE